MNVKEFVWFLMGRHGQNFYLRRKNLFNVKRKKNNKDNSSKARIVLMDTPTHGNLGDHAIILAEHRFIEERFPEKKILEFTHQECKYCLKEIKKIVAKEDIIIMPGGGFVGTLWENEQLVLEQILKSFSENKIIFFPQTVFFEKTVYGDEMQKNFIDILNECEMLHFFVRDKASYNWFEDHKDWLNDKIKFELVPDIVTSLKYNKLIERKKQILFVFRNDKEKVSEASTNLFIIKNEFEKRGYNVRETDTVLETSINIEEREKNVIEKLDEFAASELVITDRLHGMIFSAITSTPCIAVDNLSKKVSGGYEWLKELAYIELVDSANICVDIVDKKVNTLWQKYTRNIFEKHYIKIEASIKKDELL